MIKLYINHTEEGWIVWGALTGEFTGYRNMDQLLADKEIIQKDSHCVQAVVVKDLS